MSEKEAEIQSLKKKLKLPHDSHVETAGLKIVLEEKQNMESELQILKLQQAHTRAKKKN